MKRKSSAQDLPVRFGAESRIHGVGLVRDQLEILVPSGGNKVQSREFALIGPVGKRDISRSDGIVYVHGLVERRLEAAPAP